MSTIARIARSDDVPALVVLAARTFPLSCPPGSDPLDIADHIERQLGPDQFLQWCASPRHRVVVAEGDAGITGYAIVVRHPEAEGKHEATVVAGARVELSKMYVDASAHGTGVAGVLMSAALVAAQELDESSAIYLNTSTDNVKARSFYEKNGFVQVGTQTFWLGTDAQSDVVMLHPAPRASAISVAPLAGITADPAQITPSAPRR